MTYRAASGRPLPPIAANIDILRFPRCNQRSSTRLSMWYRPTPRTQLDPVPDVLASLIWCAFVSRASRTVCVLRHLSSFDTLPTNHTLIIVLWSNLPCSSSQALQSKKFCTPTSNRLHSFNSRPSRQPVLFQLPYVCWWLVPDPRRDEVAPVLASLPWPPPHARRLQFQQQLTIL